jgi:hypothetical protein
MIPTVQKIDLIDSALKRRFCDDVRKQQTPSYKPISCSVDDLDENFDGPESLEDQYLSITRQKKNEPLHEHRKDGNVVIPKESHVFLRNSQLSSSRHERIVTNVNAVLKPSDRRCFQSRDSLRSSHIVNPSYQRSNLSVENYAPQVSTPHQSALSMAAGNPKGIPSKGNTCESSKIKFVGKVLVDSNRLIHNATSFTGSTKQFNINSILAKRASSNENLNPSKKIKTPSNHIPNVTSKSVRDKTKPETISKTDIQELLNRKSAHEVEAKEEWFENYSKRLDNLSKREYAIMKQNETTSIKVVF